jgi:DNA modification methylase
MIKIRDLSVALMPRSALTLNPRNPRTHSKHQVRQIARSIETFGWTNPVLVDKDNRVVAGHGRLLAADVLKIDHVPVIRITDMTEAQRRAYVIADNKLAENAGWNSELLALELGELIDLDFDVTVTGFEIGEVDFLLADSETGAAAVLPQIDPATPPVTRLGDLWNLGPHRLLCADSTSAAAFDRLLAGAKCQMVFADPPFNLRISGHVSGMGAVHHEEFAMASGEMSSEEYVTFLKQTLGLMPAHIVDGGIAFLCIDWRHVFELLTAARSVFSELKNICIWTKDNGGMGSLYRSQHEMVCVFKHGRAPHINNVELGRHGRHRTNVWSYPGMNSFAPERAELLSAHPTVKPTALVRDAILDCSTPDGIVLDSFAGSGTTILAAELSRRRAFAIELEPRYCDVALRRYSQLTGTEPILSETDLSYSAVTALRVEARTEMNADAQQETT